MFKVVAWHAGWGILLNLVVVAVTAVLFSLVSLFFAPFTGFIPPAIVGHIAAAFVCGGGLYGISYFFGINTHLSALSKYGGKYERMWYRTIERNKRVKAVPFQAVLLILLAFAVLFVVLAKNVYAGLSINMHEEGGSLGGWVLAVITSASALTWFVHWFYLTIHYFCSTCRCGCVMSRIEGSTEGSKCSKGTQTKTKETYGVIGELYEDEKKVGDIKGTTGYYNLRREVKTYSWTSACRCAYCGRPKKVFHSETHYGDWKR